ncbi:DNA glycosylase, partial [Streptomyces sp. NPDC001215]
MVRGARHTGGYLRDLVAHRTRTVDAPGDPTVGTEAGAFLGTSRVYVLATDDHEYVRDMRTGIGNVYKSELCFLLRVTPWLPVG